MKRGEYQALSTIAWNTGFIWFSSCSFLWFSPISPKCWPEKGYFFWEPFEAASFSISFFYDHGLLRAGIVDWKLIKKIVICTVTKFKMEWLFFTFLVQQLDEMVVKIFFLMQKVLKLIFYVKIRNCYCSLENYRYVPSSLVTDMVFV